MVSNMDVESGLIPFLPHEIAMSCLVRLSRRNRALASCVSRAWLNAFTNNSTVISLRRSLNLSPEHWIFIALFDSNKCDGDYVHATHHNTKWLLLDPLALTLQPLVLPNPLVPAVSIDINLCSAATDNQLFLPQVNGFCSYNIPGRRESGDWQSVKLPTGHRCRRFGCAEINEYIYLSGGMRDPNREASRTALRYDTRTKQWETLPDMIMPRINCAGVAWNGKFFAMGGYYNSFGGFMEAHVSGESFDPESGEWTLVPNLCGNGLRYAENSDVTELGVAAVENKLYAMQPQTNEVMQLRVESEQWTHFGYVGGDCEMLRCAINYRLLGVGSELWVIEYMMGKSMQIYSCNCKAGQVSETISRKWRRIEIAGMDKYDHVLTCTTLRV